MSVRECYVLFSTKKIFIRSKGRMFNVTNDVIYYGIFYFLEILFVIPE